MSEQMITLSLVTKSDLAWGAAYNLLAGVVLDHGNEFAQTHLTTVDMDDIPETEDEPELYHDEDTLVKVFNAIKNCTVGGNHELAQQLHDEEVKDIINALQNAGILFREIQK